MSLSLIFLMPLIICSFFFCCSNWMNFIHLNLHILPSSLHYWVYLRGFFFNFSFYIFVLQFPFSFVYKYMITFYIFFSFVSREISSNCWSLYMKAALKSSDKWSIRYISVLTIAENILTFTFWLLLVLDLMGDLVFEF